MWGQRDNSISNGPAVAAEYVPMSVSAIAPVSAAMSMPCLKELFDFDRDVESITVNRWAHGYSYGNPGPVGRQPFGRITIANSDANDVSLVQSAIGHAHRAVQELK